MAKDKEQFERIGLSFHQTFVPERNCLSSLMKFASQPIEADTEVIAEETGIPTGESSGKVEPTINYGKGMGLLDVSRGQVKKWQLQLTPLGKIVLLEDQYISEGFTQWILHLHLCRRNGGAEAWHAVFGDSAIELGSSFSEESLKTFLITKFGNRSNLVGPLLRMYTSEASFVKCGALVEDGSSLKRESAPCVKTHFPGYFYMFSVLWDNLFCGEQQVAYEAFERKTRYFASMNWSISQINSFLDQLADDRLAKIDRQTGSPIILRLSSTDSALHDLYSNLL